MNSQHRPPDTAAVNAIMTTTSGADDDLQQAVHTSDEFVSTAKASESPPRSHSALAVTSHLKALPHSASPSSASSVTVVVRPHKCNGVLKRKDSTSRNSSTSSNVESGTDAKGSDGHPQLIKEDAGIESTPEFTLSSTCSSLAENRFFSKGLWTPGRIKNKCCRLCVWITLFSIVVNIILLPIMFKIIIPQMISQGFRDGTGMSNAPFNIQSLRILSVADRAAPTSDIPSEVTSNMAGADLNSFPVSGSANVSLRMWNSGYSVPLNLPVTIKGPLIFTMSLPRGYISDDGATSRYNPPRRTANGDEYGDAGSSSGLPADPTANGWYPMSVVQLSNDITISGGVLTLNMDLVRLLVPSAPPPILGTGSLAIDPATISPNSTSSEFPVGVAFMRGVCAFMMSGNPKDMPKILVESTANFQLGPIWVPDVPLYREVDMGQLMADSGVSLQPKAKSSSTSSGLGGDLGVSVTNLTNGAERSLQALITLTLPESSPFTIAVSDLSFRLNISTTPIATIVVSQLATVQGDKSISFIVNFALPDFAETVNLLSTFTSLTFTPSSKWVLGVDSVVVGAVGPSQAEARRHQWLQEMLDQIWLQFPFSLLSGQAGAQAGYILVKILESITSSNLFSK